MVKNDPKDVSIIKMLKQFYLKITLLNFLKFDLDGIF